MPLDRKKLAAAIKNTFDTSSEEGWTTEQVAEGLADAIDAYIRAGEVRDVKTKLQLDLPNNTGSGLQVGSVQLQ